MSTFCPATMCPLFAADGSAWTDQSNAACSREQCGWFFDGRCMAGAAALTQVLDTEHGKLPPRYVKREPQTFDCPRARDCQWQIEAGQRLCPPREALARGVDPRACAW